MSVQGVLKRVWEDFKRLGKEPFTAIVIRNSVGGDSVTLFCNAREGEQIATKLRNEILQLAERSNVSVEVAPHAAGELNAAFHSLSSHGPS